MSGVCKEAETLCDSYQWYQEMIELTPHPMTTREALASSAARVAMKTHSKLIIVLAASGSTARMVAKYRPDVPILVAVVPKSTGMRDMIGFESRASSMQVARQCNLIRGCIPFVSQTNVSEMEAKANSSGLLSQDSAVDFIIREAIMHAVEKGMIDSSDNVVCMHNIGENNYSLPVLKVIPAAWALEKAGTADA